MWQSDGQSGYLISEAPAEKSIESSGTIIEMKLGNEGLEFLERYRIQHVVQTYSNHISFPIELIVDGGEAFLINSSSALWDEACKYYWKGTI